MNNYEKIKGMNIDELADFLANKTTCNICYFHNEITKKNCYEKGCTYGVKKWLESEVEMMKLKDLKRKIDFLYEQYKNHPEIPDDLDVVITTSEHSIGGRAKVDVRYASRGFDWERNQFRIEPVCKLIKVSEAENE